MRLAYLTASFPYGAGESFISPELEYHLSENNAIVLCPLWARGNLTHEKLLKRDSLIMLDGRFITLKMLLYLIRFICVKPVAFLRILNLVYKSKLRHLGKNVLLIPKALFIARMVKRYEVDHIHVHWSSTTATAGMIASIASKIDWSFTCHRWDIYDGNLLNLKSISAKFVRFISERGRLDGINRGIIEEKAVVIHMGVEIPTKNYFSKYNSKSDVFNIICPANLIEVKGHFYLIDSIDKLIKNGYNVKLYLAGDGSLKNELKSKVELLGLGNNVVFLGQISHDELLKRYREQNIHCVVLPSVDLGCGMHEGIPVSLIEGMAFGKLVISTQTGSIPELLPNNLNVTTIDKDHLKLANLIGYYIDNPSIYSAKCQELNSLFISDWTIGKSMNSLVDVLLNK